MKNKTSIIFTGDIGFDRYMDGKWNDTNLLSAEIKEYFGTADHVVANVEGPLGAFDSNTENSGVKQLLHTMNPDATKLLDSINADIWNICNNHIMDAGEQGMASTLKIAKQHNAQTIGAGMNIAEAQAPVIIDEAGKIGMFGVGYQRACRAAGENKAGCYSWSDLDAIQSTINKIKSTCRWCVVVAHAGEEFTSLPMPYTRERYLKYLEMGADIVVAHHPHVPMNYETVGNKAIFYSLGNFIFDTPYQRSQYNTDIGVLLRVDFTEENFSFTPMGIKIDRENEYIVKDNLPRIFTDVNEEQYKLLAPLSAKMMIAATKRQQRFLFPNDYDINTTEEQWQENFSRPLRSGRVPGETLDYAIICPLAEKESEKAWQQSTLEDVKNYILEQIPDLPEN